MRQMTTMRGILAGLALISLVGIAPALAQSNPDPQTGLVPIGGRILALPAELDPLPRYAVIPRVQLEPPSDLPPVDVKPIDAGQPAMRGGALSGESSGERSAMLSGSGFGGPRNFGGASAAAALPERHVDVRRVRDELADVRAELGL